METLQLFQKYFFKLTEKYGFKINFNFEKCELNLEIEDLQKLLQIGEILRETEISEKSAENLKCEQCQKTFSHKTIIQFHRQEIHGNQTSPNLSEQEFSCCVQCHKCYKTHEDFQKHECELKLKLPQNLEEFQSKFKCGQCFETFKTISRIKFHMKHCKNEELNCDKCEFKSKSSQKLQIHKSTKHGQNFKCELCDKSFKLKTSYHKHLIAKHESQNVSYQCDKCPKKFIKKIYLTNHLLRFHHLKKDNLCNHCGEMFLTQETLKKHVFEHFNSMTYKCTSCDKVFKRKDKVSLIQSRAFLLSLTITNSLCVLLFLKVS